MSARRRNPRSLFSRVATLSRVAMRTLARGLLLTALFSCGGDQEAIPRCAQCGMRADLDPRWAAGLTDADGHPQHFDAPKCLFQWRATHPGTKDAWFTAYYAQERRPITSLRFVIGSGLTSPMGRDLVPIAGDDEAARFTRDHGGQVLRAAQIDGDVLANLDR